MLSIDDNLFKSEKKSKFLDPQGSIFEECISIQLNNYQKYFLIMFASL